MPNWCHNVLNVSGPANLVDQFLLKAANKDIPLSLNSLVPQNTKAKRYQNAVQRHVAGEGSNPNFNWYDWNIDHWGCKWDCRDVTVTVAIGCGQKAGCEQKTVVFTFETPYNPPTKVYRKITAKFKGLSFNAYAWEPNMSFWCHFSSKDGFIHEDKSVDIDQNEKLKAAIIDRLDFLGFEATGGDMNVMMESLEDWYLDDDDMENLPEASIIIDTDEKSFRDLAKEAGFKKKK